MNDVQLDKNSYARRLRDQCNKEGIVKCCAPPHHLLDAADEMVIAFAIQSERLLLTYDRPIAFDCPQSLMNGFPGILVLALEDNSPRRMGRKVAMALLQRFKSDCPQWHMFDYRNSVVELQPGLIFVHHLEHGQVKLSGWVERSRDGWQMKMRELLQVNAARTFP